MAAKIVDYYRIVQPTAPTATVTDNQLLSPGYASSTNYTWYHKIIQGSASRQARYNEYNAMDNDVEISRALDIIAEAMAQKNGKTNMALDLEMVTDEGQNLDDTLVITLKTALRHWSELHGFEGNRLFKIVRNMIKYGDCFFKKSSNFKKWEWVPSSQIMGVVVHADDVTQVVAYQVKTNTKSTSAANFSNTTYKAIEDSKDFEIIPADKMVVFTINDDMSDEAPFGESVLRTVYKTHKQKELIEDAMIIYRIQRAPEKRVYYIDVGKIHPSRVKTYLETIKNEIKQKPIASNNMRGGASIDAVYNPNSMLEDIFLAQRCISLDTLIHIVNIGSIPLSQVIQNYIDGIRQDVLSVNLDSGLVEIRQISWAGITKYNEPVVNVTFNNGKMLTCTPDHKLITANLEAIETQELKLNDSLIGVDKNLSIIEISNYNETMDVGCLTVDTHENNHNFFISSGIFIKNSDGVGSKVEVLQSGNSLGELSDLEYLADKVLRGLRVPISWMKPGANNAIFNDGKLGAAYVEERQFDKFTERLSVYAESTLDTEFKKFLFASNINIDHTLFNVKLPKSSNYQHYQQAEMDSTLLSMISSADSLPYLSKRFILKNYLQLDETGILENEQLLMQEKGLDKNKDRTLQQLYGAGGEGEMGGGIGGMGGMPDMGGLGAPMGPGEIGGPGDDTINIGGAPGAPGPEGGLPAMPEPLPA